MLNHLLLCLAVAGTIFGFWRHRQHRSGGAVWVLLSTGLAVGVAARILMLPDHNPQVMEEMAEAFDACAGEFLGRQLAERFPNQKVMVLLPLGHGAREAGILEGLKTGLGDSLELIGTRTPEVPPSFRDELKSNMEGIQLSEGEMKVTIEGNYLAWFTRPVFESLLDELAGETDILVAALTVPTIERKPGHPRLALINGSVKYHREMIVEGSVEAAVAWRPAPQSWPVVDRLPDDLRERFDLRFICITSDNVAALDRQHPQLFLTPEEEAPHGDPQI